MASGSTRDAIGAARVAIIRLNPAKHAEELAADLLDAWTAVEAAVRALVGPTAATGMDLVREARQLQLFTFDQANALAAFYAVAERLRDNSNLPSGDDVAVTRRVLAALDAASTATPITPGEEAPPDQSDAWEERSITPPGMRSSPLAVEQMAPEHDVRRSRRGLWVVFVVLVVGGALAGGAYYWFGGPRRDAVVRQAITEYEAGNRTAASADFRSAVLMDPGYAISHVYLARIARDAGNFPAANDELQLALSADPGSALALREMGAYLFTVGSFDLARKFYIRAVSANPEDATAKGYLGCTLVKLGRIDDGERWITRAGPGVWTTCVTGAAPADTTH